MRRTIENSLEKYIVKVYNLTQIEKTVIQNRWSIEEMLQEFCIVSLFFFTSITDFISWITTETLLF